MSTPRFIPLEDYREYSEAEMLERSTSFYDEMRRRRTVRHFSDRSVPRDVIEQCLRTAGTAPNGANLQPWHFVVVSDAATKKQIRRAAEEEERAFYERRATQEWLDILAPLGTDATKPFLERAPYLIAVFSRNFVEGSGGERQKAYYPVESVGLATGLLIAGLHHSGLATLTHTPSPMNFLREILGRPDSDRPFVLLVVGYPEEDARVPDIERKPLGDICDFV